MSSNRKSELAASIKDQESSISNYSRRNSQENFITEFLTHCEEYDIETLPSFVVRDGTEQYAKIESEKVKMDEDIPIFYVSFENSKKMETVRKLECKGQEVSICILVALNTTLQKYNTITVLKLPSCQINAYGILQITHMLTELECLNDLNLDGNPNPQENYYLLCAPARNLRYLSLRMCKLSDNGMQKIANELKYRDPPNVPKLIALNVADNDITDIGAEYIAEMLRTNRSLQSVVLTGNEIQDDGVSLIIQELVTSTLTHEEIVDLRRRRFIKLESKLDSRDTEGSEQRRENGAWQSRNLLKNSESITSQDSSSKMRAPSNSLSISNSSIQISKKLSDNDIDHPFIKETIAINYCVMTSGNLNLQHLSLSFNRLTNKTLKKLVSCLHYQNFMLLGNYSRGLLHVFLEGNDIEKDEDWITFQELLCRRRQKNQTIRDVDLNDSIVSVECEILRSKISLI
ncbi:Leucine-rich repeat-containing protein C10orf92 like protein [Trachymyrmex septentrionalis]|uniref:Leucine-rich repeat-containing protein C10orf92 like protein n=1 Tax=Trachymyrmex septentrionalis TaxID=34720 RepID=A0A195FQW7_9HYME|nr:Leucine-rich repeat-containing protein C10orf92 like protein [Trachymyrmex septentrionalis]